MSRFDCTYCGATLADCLCGDANAMVARSPSGYPIDSAGVILTHLCTPEQRRTLNAALIPNYRFDRRQAS